jgi:hypothetical protein
MITADRFLALVMLCAWPAAQAATPSTFAGDPPARAMAALDRDVLARAMAALDRDRIAADLEFLCDPALAGRGTATVEADHAARFVEARLRRLGIEPGSSDGYRPRFELLRRHLAGDLSRVVIEREGERLELGFGRELFLRGRGDLIDVDLAGALVGVGEGGRDDFERAGDLSGAWAIALDRGRGTTAAVRRAAEAGAAGVLLTPADEYDREPYPVRYESSTRGLFEGSLESPLGRPPRSAEGPPVLMLSREGAKALAGFGGIKPAALTSAGARHAWTLSERRVARVDTATSPNVAGLLRGSDPERADELIVLCAHLDHLGERDGELFPGADDNGSGSVGLLALAEALATRGPLARSVLMLWVTGEEAGLWGSAAWCEDPRLPEGLDPIAAFNLDMIGRDDPEELWLTPSAEHREHNPLAALVYELAPLEGFTNLVSQDSYWSASDHFNFSSRLRIPVVYLSSGEHEQYHRPTDTPDLIDLDKLVRILRLHLRLLEASDALPLDATGR